MAVLTGDEVWADFNGDGSINEPLLQNIRVWSRYIELLAQTLGFKTYATKSAMDADTTQADGTPALIFADPTPANNYPTVWVWNDAGNVWGAGTDRLSALQALVDALMARIEDRFQDPEGLGARSLSFGGVSGYDGNEPIISLTTSGTAATWVVNALGEFAVGNTVTFAGIRWSDVVGAVGTFSASVRIRFYQATGAEITASLVESKSPVAANTHEAFSINGVVPANTAFILFEIAKGTTGTLAKFKARFLSAKSSTSPAVRGRPRDRGRQVFPDATVGPQLGIYDGGIFRDPTGRALSTADGPCAITGLKWCFSLRDAVAVSGRVMELQDQLKGIKLLPAGAAPGVRDRRGYGSGNGTGRLQADNVGVLTAKLLDVAKLPDSAADVPPSGGFASTGLAKIPLGAATYAGCWVVANHGRADESDLTSNASIIILSPDGRVKLAEYNQAATTGTGSIQGVAVRTVGGVSAIWYNDKSAKLLRELSLTGTLTGTTISLAAITPNGATYDATNDLFWITNEGVASAQSYVAATGALGSTCIIPSNTDQMFCDAQGYLWVSYGNNGSDCTVDCRDPETNVLVQRWSGLPLCQAIEGIHVETTGAGTVLTCVNDGGFHVIAKPALNLMLKYVITAPPPRANTNELMICLRLRLTGTPSQTCYVIADGSPLDIVYYGWAVAVVNATTIRFQVRTNGDAAAVSVDFVVPGLLSLVKWQTITFYASKTASSVRCWANGTELTAVGSPSLAAVSKKFGTNRISKFGLIGSTPRYLEATDVAVAIVADTNDRAPAEAHMPLATAGFP
jgi:hypothetical protein